MWDFFVRVMCVRESVKTQGKLKTQEVFTSSLPVKWSMCLAHDWIAKSHDRMVTVGFHKCLASKVFPWDTRKTFCFAILSYLIHPISTYTIYTHITHICWGVLFREKILATTLESERLLYPQFSTQSIVVFLNSYLSISKSLRCW